jgi:hypothetical protein
MNTKTGSTIACFLALVVCNQVSAAERHPPDPRLTAGNTFVLKFPDLPPDARDIRAAMTITLP